MSVRILTGDCRTILPTLDAGSVQCCVTSPPYFGLRDYGVAGQIGLEQTPEQYVAELVAVFREVRRVLRDDGTLWLNLGDSYAAQRGGTAMPAETLAGGVGGIGDDAAHRGRRSTKTLGGRQDESSPEIRTYAVAHRNARAFGLKHKDLIGIPWMVAFALRADGWYLRSDIVWSKPNPMPESVTDRPTKAHEYLFLLAKSERYHYDAAAIAEPASQATLPRLQRAQESENRADGVPGQPAHGLHRPRRSDKQRGHGRRHAGFNDRWDAMEKAEQCSGMRNKRTVWTVATLPFKDAHFATFPPALIEPCILAGCPKGGTVLDPFGGAGTTGLVADRLGRDATLIELNPQYVRLADKRITDDGPLFAEVSA